MPKAPKPVFWVPFIVPNPVVPGWAVPVFEKSVVGAAAEN